MGLKDRLETVQLNVIHDKPLHCHLLLPLLLLPVMR
jgi:hypothetical protein